MPIKSIAEAFRVHTLLEMAFYDLLTRPDEPWPGAKAIDETRKRELTDQEFRQLFFEVALGKDPCPNDSATRTAPSVLLNWLLTLRSGYQRASDALFYVRPALPKGVASILRGDYEFTDTVLMDTSGALRTHALFAEIQSTLSGIHQSPGDVPEELDHLNKLLGQLINALGMWGQEPEVVVRRVYPRNDQTPEEAALEQTPPGYTLDRWDMHGQLVLNAWYKQAKGA